MRTSTRRPVIPPDAVAVEPGYHQYFAVDRFICTCWTLQDPPANHCTHVFAMFEYGLDEGKFLQRRANPSSPYMPKIYNDKISLPMGAGFINVVCNLKIVEMKPGDPNTEEVLVVSQGDQPEVTSMLQLSDSLYPFLQIMNSYWNESEWGDKIADALKNPVVSQRVPCSNEKHNARDTKVCSQIMHESGVYLYIAASAYAYCKFAMCLGCITFRTESLLPGRAYGLEDL